MLYVPGPTAGLNEEPLTPVPLKVPPDGVPVSATAAAFEQTAEYVPALTVGAALTVMEVDALLEQPFAFVYA